MSNPKANKLDLKALILGNSDRLRHVVRFGNCRRLKDESVAEHCFFVAWYTYVIGLYLQEETGLRFDFERALGSALIHDLEESRSGDFPRDFKYSDPKLKHLLDEAGAVAFQQVVEPIFGKCDKNRELRTRLNSLWVRAKDETLEGSVVAFADYLSCLCYLWSETASGNRTVLAHAKEMDRYHLLFEDARFELIRNLVDQAEDILQEIFSNGQH